MSRRDEMVSFGFIDRKQHLYKLPPQTCLVSADAFQRLPAHVHYLKETLRHYLLTISVTKFPFIGLLRLRGGANPSRNCCRQWHGCLEISSFITTMRHSGTVNSSLTLLLSAGSWAKRK